MRVSAKAEYACVAMMELAANHGDNQPVRIRSIADAQGLASPRFLVQILLQLKTHGLVKSVRGAGGGYQLSRAPGAISLYDILKAVEDPALTSDTVLKDATTTPTVRTLTTVWREIQDEQDRLLRELTLAELLRRSRESSSLEYQI